MLKDEEIDELSTIGKECKIFVNYTANEKMFKLELCKAKAEAQKQLEEHRCNEHTDLKDSCNERDKYKKFIELLDKHKGYFTNGLY